MNGGLIVVRRALLAAGKLRLQRENSKSVEGPRTVLEWGACGTRVVVKTALPVALWAVGPKSARLALKSTREKTVPTSSPDYVVFRIYLAIEIKIAKDRR
jgi:hypothetical protein